MAKKDFISLKNLDKRQILDIVDLAGEIKKNPEDFSGSLARRQIGILFEKPSLRTKTSFYIGACQLGANPVYYDSGEVCLRKREEIRDVSRTLSQYLDAVVLRTFAHADILEFADFSSVPVINALTGFLHPSQAIADIFTILQLKPSIENIKVSYIGDSNNVCNSLIYAFSLIGGNLHIAAPGGYSPDKKVVEEAENNFSRSGGSLTIGTSPGDAAEAADVLYTDVWTSMGSEQESEKRNKVFKNFQINDTILKRAKSNCIVMHCLPAHRGQEISDSVIEGENSMVFLQAANRLYAAKAILCYALG